MIKTIKKIDIQGNEIWQEVYVCNRCKRTLSEDEYVYTTEWKSYFPVKPKGLVAFGFSEGSNPDIHICENCSTDVQRFWNGEYICEDCKKEVESLPEDEKLKEQATPKLKTYAERVAIYKKKLENESTTALNELRSSFLCAAEVADAIDLILKERR